MISCDLMCVSLFVHRHVLKQKAEMSHHFSTGKSSEVVLGTISTEQRCLGRLEAE